MSEDSGGHKAPTRRDYMKYGGAVIGSSALAGCAGLFAPDDTGGTETSTVTATGTESETATEDVSYSVTMAPMGEVTFDSIPEQWVPYGGDYADMGVALGHADSMIGIGQPGEYYTYVYEELPGVSVDKDRIEKNDLVEAGMSKELFYEMDSDVHIIDTGMLRNWFDWRDEDIAEISEQVGPFLGNMIFRRSDSWHDYRFYTLYEAFEKVAELFQERDRYEAFKQYHDEFITEIQSRMPPSGERPNVMLTFEGTNEPDTFSPYRLTDKGTSKKQWNDLGVADALAGTDIENLSTDNRGELDYENLLEVDPDVLLIRGHEQKSASEFRDTVLAYMKDHPVGSELTAVQNNRVYRGGYLRQGPIHNLFLTERAAKQLYPDVFGDVTSDTKLFDRQRVADIINGDI
ncbi:ferrichrome-binding protein [Halogeometricum borinquense DSM 11551]|uniref:Ferrichrome-binding protein n=1 Tax=Halogeometricum borinquense (strain ATCC 700274 / DSM 11551 / JCM 10706 / KCTC 4070 / PR3) TaxID=469382 RepID=E4NVC7_HALBP|nr:ABC transporter substrate-binding protein [Halogeometricum borinquense]ADQ69116.1 ferrichrome-binding protein [Halogeometricum borinquense DSM 11551]ELY29381.1 ferrichrome-binding protein [Halogeometricum borinquense DSM 11551]